MKSLLLTLTLALFAAPALLAEGHPDTTGWKDLIAPDFSNLRFGAGIGGRFYTNFGPMRLDVATPIGRKPGEARVTVYVSIGQAF